MLCKTAVYALNPAVKPANPEPYLEPIRILIEIHCRNQ
jgi:hypothetical protein